MTSALHLVPESPAPDDLHSQLIALLPAELVNTDLDLHTSSPLGKGRPCSATDCPRSTSSTEGFCSLHYERWQASRQSDTRHFGDGPTEPHRLQLTQLPLPLRSEIAYGAHRLRQQEEISLSHAAAADLIRALLDARITSIVEADGVAMSERAKRGARSRPVGGWRSFLRFTLDEVEAVAGTATAEREFARERWRLRRLGCSQYPDWAFSFDAITQPWLRQVVRRFLRWRFSTGHSPSGCHRDLKVLGRLSWALAETAGEDAQPSDLTRKVIERLRLLLAEDGRNLNGTRIALSSVKTFFTTVRQHEWLPGLPSATAVYSDDLPRTPPLAARFLSEFVMAELEKPANLDKLTDPRWRLLFPLLMQTGLRLGDGIRLELDCVVRDHQQAAYLRYFNHKMDREAMVPISPELEEAISVHARTVLDGCPTARVLFPRVTRIPHGHHAAANAIAAVALKQWLISCEVRDEFGRPVELTAHQFRHTFATRLINNDVPQDVVRRLLDHSSTEMTAHYARLHDTTVREHWERARKVNINGDAVLIHEESPLADAAWMKQHLGRASMALPNGFCGLPVQQTCPHANACLTCPVFVTTPEFLDQHREQLAHTQQIVERAQARGQLRLVEMNQRVTTSLINIITALETDEEDHHGDQS